jgi:uncharacterized protein (UPF0147 family)
MAGMSPVPADQFEAFKRMIDDSKDVIEPASFAQQRRRAAKRAKKALRRDTIEGNITSANAVGTPVRYTDFFSG